MARSWYRPSERRHSSMWPAYVPVAERQRQARKEVDALRKRGRTIAPIVLSGRQIATTFWGKSWCANLEAYSDYANRLPRGRTYVRNGSVVHLEIAPGKVEALVRGSSMYTVEITIASLARQRWNAVVGECSGKIDSLMELLQGKLSKGVMEVVTHTNRGLFPGPKEIQLSCSCPDWATMCKHVAAVLYGVGARLDTHPDLLFRLRGVDPAALFTKVAVGRASATLPTTGKLLATDALSSVFGIDIDEGAAAVPSRERPVPTLTKGRRQPAKKTVTVPKRGEEAELAPAARARKPRATEPRRPDGPLVRVTVAELARAGARVIDIRHWLDAGELAATRESGVYETSPAIRTRLLGRQARRG